MNESLISPFNITHPTAVQTSLSASAAFARFDPSGKYLAAGSSTGTATIWDLETKASIRMLDGHVKAVTSIDWSANSQWVLTSSKDWNVIIWDLSTTVEPMQRDTTIRFDAPVVSASFHPRNSKIILALLGTGEAFVVDLREERSRVELCEATEPGEEDSQNARRSAMTVARFHPSGKWIFVGTSTGTFLVFNARTKAVRAASLSEIHNKKFAKMVARHRISGATGLKGIDFIQSGRRMVTNSSDRTIRQFVVPNYLAPSADGTFLDEEIEPTHKFNDPINRTAWNGMAYSPDGEWLAGGAADPATHKIYIWDLSNDGQFATTLDGGREPLVHLHWHPMKSSIASTTNHGNILLWHNPSPERWGAFAGGFEEVDENVEYEEREDEFDIEDEEEIFKRKMKAEEEEVDIDTTVMEDSKPNGQPEGMDIEDEDFAWADQGKSDTAEFQIKVLMQDESDL